MIAPADIRRTFTIPSAGDWPRWSRVRRRLATALAVITGIAAVAGQTPSASADVVHVPRALFGLHDGSMKAYDQLPFGSLRLWDAGVSWQAVETAPGVYDWSRLDALVSAAQAHHVKVTLVLAMTPPFYSDAPSLPPQDLSAYARYVEAAMTRYRSFHGHRGIAAYQVWNEGNISYFWSATPAELAQLTQIVDRVRDQVDPAATVVAPSFAVRLRYQRTWMASYQRQQVDGHPVWNHYDVNALSLYPKPSYAGRPGGPEDAMRLLGQARHQFHEIGVPQSKGIWATEVNYGVTGGGLAAGAATPISERRQVANVLRTYLLGAAKGLSRIFWYRYDWGRVANGGTLGNTLLTDPDDVTRVSAAGLALRTAEHWLHGRLVERHGHPLGRPDRKGTYTLVVRHDGHVRTILWNPRQAVRVPIPRTATYIQTASGERTRVGRTQTSVRVSYLPVMVRSSR